MDDEDDRRPGRQHRVADRLDELLVFAVLVLRFVDVDVVQVVDDDQVGAVLDGEAQAVDIRAGEILALVVRVQAGEARHVFVRLGLERPEDPARELDRAVRLESHGLPVLHAHRLLALRPDSVPALEGLAAAATQMLQLLAPQHAVPAIAVLDHRDLPYDALWAPERIAAAGDADVVVAGGMESMSNTPSLLPQARSGYRMGHAEVVDGMYRDGANQQELRSLIGWAFGGLVGSTEVRRCMDLYPNA